MKYSIGRVLASLVAGVLLLGAVAQAQLLNDHVVTFAVPFEFTIGQKTFPAGSYSAGSHRTLPAGIARRRQAFADPGRDSLGGGFTGSGSVQGAFLFRERTSLPGTGLVGQRDAGTGNLSSQEWIGSRQT